MNHFQNLIMLNSFFQETLRQTSRRSGTKSHARLLTQHTLPACWTRVPSAWRRGCAWTAAARASALCPATSATWVLGLHVLQNLCCSTSLKPRQSTSWSTATRPTRYLWLKMLYSHPLPGYPLKQSSVEPGWDTSWGKQRLRVDNVLVESTGGLCGTYCTSIEMGTLTPIFTDKA